MSKVKAAAVKSPKKNVTQNKKVTPQEKEHTLYSEALEFHSRHPKGKVALDLPKPLTNQRDLSLAYSPGVAAPCLEIHKDPRKAYEYTAKGNYVAVISNGTAVLGLGNLGALASKPVMEGKAVLFKRFADIDAVDIEVSTEDPEKFINAVRYLGASWGGINLEDIKAPECFIIESELKKLMDIPVFHDDQHGTAIIAVAGLINAAHITGRKFDDMKVVVNGAGAAAIACVELIKSVGVKSNNVILCDTKGVIYEGRKDGMNQWKSAHAVKTKTRTLQEALVGADVFLGLSAKDAVNPAMVKTMADKPIIFAMANPDPEITPAQVKSVRADAIVATGRSDYANQVNNVMGFPYIFRGALDVQATTINESMKIAAARAVAQIAREDVPEEVSAAYAGRKLKYGPDYIIPTPFDPRLIHVVPVAVAQAAVDSGVAKKPIKDFVEYKRQLLSRLNPTNNLMNLFFERLKSEPKRMIFSEGDEEQMVRAAVQWRNQGYGTPVLVGYEEGIRKKLKAIGASVKGIEITNAGLNENTPKYIAQLYTKLQRKGFLQRDCARMVKRDRNIFASMMLENNEADAMITGLTRPYISSLDDVTKIIDKQENKILFGLSALVCKGRTIFIADTTINEIPTSQELVDIAIQAAHEVRHLGHEPRVAFVSFSNFGNPMREKAERVRNAVALMNERKDIDFEYDGEMQANVALNSDMLKLYPFCRLTQPANILIMPALHSANISSKLLQELGGTTLIGPILCGLSKPVQILTMGARETDILNLAALCAHRIDRCKEKKRS
jgi:malate dehydrogenase (oxaloacetate-decarboxylating)(NADP+)